METKYQVSGYFRRGYCQALEKFIENHKTRDCKKCKALWSRRWRKNNPLTDDQKKKDNARSYARVYLLRGKIKKENCVKCSNPNSEMHHSDYNKPLNILWLCRTCHMKLHKETE